MNQPNLSVLYEKRMDLREIFGAFTHPLLYGIIGVEGGIRLFAVKIKVMHLFLLCRTEPAGPFLLKGMKAGRLFSLYAQKENSVPFREV